MDLDYSYWERLEKVIKWTGLSIHSFANTIGLKSAENIYRIKNKKNGVSKNIISATIKQFPMIDEKWLMTGSGCMLAQTNKLLEESPNILFFENGAESLLEAPQKESIRFSLPFFKETCLSFEMKGDDLTPEINDEDVIIASKIPNDEIVLGEIFIIKTKKEVFVRRVYEHNKDGAKLSLCCESSKKRKPIHLYKKKIAEVYKVYGIIRKF